MRWSKRIVPGLCFFCLSSCGYSQQEWDQKLRDAQTLSRQVDEQRQLAAKCSNDGDAARLQLDELRGQLLKRGIRLEHLADDLERQMLAGQEYETRMLQLNTLRAQAAKLQQGLIPLREQGVRVVVRNNQITIVFPTSLLFGSPGIGLSSAGRAALEAFAATLHSEAILARRPFQVSGHTDRAQTIPKSYEDAWAFSAQQARVVLLAISGTLEAKGSEQVKGWSAAGFADTDPIARNESANERKKNQRIEIVLLPLADERLNIGEL